MGIVILLLVVLVFGVWPFAVVFMAAGLALIYFGVWGLITLPLWGLGVPEGTAYVIAFCAVAPAYLIHLWATIAGQDLRQTLTAVKNGALVVGFLLLLLGAVLGTLALCAAVALLGLRLGLSGEYALLLVLLVPAGYALAYRSFSSSRPASIKPAP